MKRTPFFDQHVRDATTVLNLKGFARALHYLGHVVEHKATRETVTLCDVSHMGELDFKGPDALALVQKIITNDASKLSVNQALYSAMCDEGGNVIDDLVCFRLGEDHFRWVVNVTRTDEDYQHVLRNANGMNVKVDNISTDTALIALQGPKSLEVLQRITKDDLSALPYYGLAQTIIHTDQAEVPCIVSRTGYTGERGFEIMIERDLAPWVWDELLLVGRPLGIVPHGVAARESLRTEAGYLLNGNDMDRKTNPYEAGIGWIVKLSKDFIGKEALEKIKAAGPARKMVGLEVDGRCTIRHGHPIWRDGRQVGHVTSGPLPTELTGRNLGLGYVSSDSAQVGTPLEIEVRGRRITARIVSLPFCARRAKDDPALLTLSPYGLRFAKSHEWAHAGDDSIITVGLSDFGQRAMGDVLAIELPRKGDKVAQGKVAGWMDTYRKAVDFISPVSGEVVDVNEAALRDLQYVNAYPYARGGLFKVRAASTRELEALMDFHSYADHTRKLRRYDTWTRDLRMT